MTAQPPDLAPAQFPHAYIFVDIQREWNAAEESIKRSEQIALDISIPAISELRYAGRRIVDALDIAHKGGDIDKIKAVLEDARFCCHRARHDSIDAALSKIAIDLDDMTSRLGYDVVAQAYPDFQVLYTAFSAARAKVAASRSDRQNRNAIYETVSAVDFPHIADHYTKLVVCKPIALGYAARRRSERIVSWVLMVAAVITMILAGLAVDWGKLGPNLRGYLGLTTAPVEHTPPPTKAPALKPPCAKSEQTRSGCG